MKIGIKNYFKAVFTVFLVVIGVSLGSSSAQAETVAVPAPVNAQPAATWSDFVTLVGRPDVDQINLTADITASANIALAGFPARNLTINGGDSRHQITMAGYTIAGSAADSSSMLSVVNVDFVGTGTTSIFNFAAANSTNWIFNFQNTTLNATSNTRPLVTAANSKVYLSGETQFKVTNTQTMITANQLSIDGDLTMVGSNAAGTTFTNASLFTNAQAGGSLKVENGNFNVQLGTGGVVYNNTGTNNDVTIDFNKVNTSILSGGSLYTGTGVTTAKFTDSPIELGTLTNYFLYTTAANHSIKADFINSPIKVTGTVGNIIRTNTATSPVEATFSNSPVSGSENATLSNFIYTAAASSDISATMTNSSIEVDNLGNVFRAVNTGSPATVSLIDSPIITQVSSGAVVGGGLVTFTAENSPVKITKDYTALIFDTNGAGSKITFNQSDLQIQQEYRKYNHDTQTAGSGTAIDAMNIGAQADLYFHGSKVDFDGRGRMINVVVGANNSSIIVDQGTKFNAYSDNLQVINTGSGDSQATDFTLSLDGSETEMNLSGSSNETAGNGGIVSITGANSNFYAKNGSKLNVHSMRKNTGTSQTTGATPCIMIQAQGGGFYVSDYSEINLTSEGNSNDLGATLRFRLVGAMTFDISNHSKFTVRKLNQNNARGTVAAAIRMFGGKNTMKVTGGSDIIIHNDGNGSASNSDNQAIQFTGNSNGGGTDAFLLDDEDSNVQITATYGSAMTADNNPVSITAGDDTYFVVRGQTASGANGIFNTGTRNVTVDFGTMKYFDFADTRPSGGHLFNVGSASTFKSAKTDLALWKSGTNVAGNPTKSFIQVTYALSGSDLVNFDSGSDQVETFLKGNGNMANMSRMNGNNQRAVIDDLRVPTNADKYIWGHAGVPEGKNEGLRDAWTDEVQVKVDVYSDASKTTKVYSGLQGTIVEGTTDTGTISVYGETEKAGIFRIALPDGVFMKEGYTVEVTEAWRGEPVFDAENAHVSNANDLQAGLVTAVDVTPPTQVVTPTDLTNATKQLTGTSDENGAKVFVKINGEWLKELDNTPTTTTVADGKWTINLPAYVTTNDKVDVYLKDTTTIDPTPEYTLPVTYTQEPDGVYGNINEEVDGYDSYTGYHDAIKEGSVDERFDPALRLIAKNVLPENVTLAKDATVYRKGTQVSDTQVGDTVQYKLTATNTTTGTAWNNVKLVDVLPAGVDFDATKAEVQMNGVDVPADQISYAADTRTLTILIGDLTTTDSVIVTFKVTVNSSAAGTTISNKAAANGENLRETPFVAGPVNPDADHEPVNVESNQKDLTNVFGVLSLTSAPKLIDFRTQVSGSYGAVYENKPDIDQHLVVNDSRASFDYWTVDVKVTQMLTSQNDSAYTLPDSLKYKNDDGVQTLIEDETKIIFTGRHTSTGDYDVSQKEWIEKDNGFVLDIPADKYKEMSDYQAVLQFTLSAVPEP